MINADAFIAFSDLKVTFPLTLAPSGVDLKVRPANIVSASALSVENASISLLSLVEI